MGIDIEDVSVWVSAQAPKDLLRLDSRDDLLKILHVHAQRTDMGDIRNDTGAFAGFARSFEHIYAQTYDKLYPEYKARNLIPLNTSVPSGAEVHTWRQFDRAGEAKVVKDYGADFPDVTLDGSEFRNPIVSLGCSYSYSIQEVRNASMMNLPIEARKALYARQVMEQKLDSMAAWGDASTTVQGLANAANILSAAAPPAGGTTATANWVTSLASTSVTAVLQDINAMVQDIFIASKGVFGSGGLTLMLPTTVYAALANSQAITPTGIFLSISVLQYILDTSPAIDRIVHWPALDKGAPGADASHDTVLLAKLDPIVCELVIPQDFEQMAPEIKRMKFSVACHLRHGGCKVTYPFAIVKYSGANG